MHDKSACNQFGANNVKGYEGIFLNIQKIITSSNITIGAFL